MGVIGALGTTPTTDTIKSKLEEGRPLTIKFGIDPNNPDIHMGHYTLIRRLKSFQSLGHRVCIVLGNGTACIGDPTGRDSSRPVVSEEDIDKNSGKYQALIAKVLDPQLTTFISNKSIYDKLNLMQLMRIFYGATVQQSLRREDFQNRLMENNPISLHECLYPLLQGYDSVAIKADIEIGAHDQLFNMMMGRQLQKYFGQPEQGVICFDYLLGTSNDDRKMSKSLDNYIAIDDPSMFAKIMQLSDERAAHYALLFDINTDDIPRKTNTEKRDLKSHIASLITTELLGKTAMHKQRLAFFAKDGIESTIDGTSIVDTVDLVACIMEISKSKAKKHLDSKAVKIGNVTVGRNNPISALLGKSINFRVGKFIRKVTIKTSSKKPSPAFPVEKQMPCDTKQKSKKPLNDINMSEKIVMIGLGNTPDSKYALTRHNVGSYIISRIVNALKIDFEPVRLKHCSVNVLEASYSNFKFITLPGYINQSGVFLSNYMSRTNTKVSEILVINDNVEIPYGKCKWKMTGSANGHNGVRDIISMLGTSDFARLLVGISKDTPLDRYVLDKHSVKELEIIDHISQNIVSAILEQKLNLKIDLSV